MSGAVEDARGLRQLIDAGHACVHISTKEEGYARYVVAEAMTGRPSPIHFWTNVRGIHSGVLENDEPQKETESAAAALYALVHQHTDAAIVVMFDLLDHLDDATTRRALREAISMFRRRGSTMLLVDHRSDVPEALATDITALDLSLPDEAELEEIVRDTVKRVFRSRDFTIEVTRGVLRSIIRNLRGLTRQQAEQVIIDCIVEDERLNEKDIANVLAAKRRQFEGDGVLEFVETPVDLDDIGGLRNLKRWLETRRSAMARDLPTGLRPPRGVLLLGVQGAGKSLSAKAIATSFGVPLLRLDPGALFDRYVGESERRLRATLRQAEAMSPIVLWIDEIEKGFASAATHSTDGGLSQRMFGTLLSWMQDHTAPVFLVATANNISALPPELLRKGRFDEIFFVDLPDRDVRRQIFAIHLRHRGLESADFDLEHLADASNGHSGAEIEQAVRTAQYGVLDSAASVTTDRLLEAVEGSPPLSVVMADRIQALRQWAADRCVPAD